MQYARRHPYYRPVALLLVALLLLVMLPGCGTFGGPPDPLTTRITLQTAEGTAIGLSSPKDTSWSNLSANRTTGDIQIADFRSNASDPTAAYIGVMEQQSRIAAEQSRLLYSLVERIAGGTPPPPPAPAPAPTPEPTPAPTPEPTPAPAPEPTPTPEPEPEPEPTDPTDPSPDPDPIDPDPTPDPTE